MRFGLLLSLGAVLTGLALAPAAAPAEKPPPERLMVRGLEFDLLLSKRKLQPGRAVIQFVNAGEDAHDLRIQRAGQAGEFGFDSVEPGEYESLETHLKRSSTYVLWCSLADHRALGMEAALRTKKRRAR